MWDDVAGFGQISKQLDTRDLLIFALSEILSFYTWCHNGRTKRMDKIRQLFKDTWKFVESEDRMESQTWRDLLCRPL